MIISIASGKGGTGKTTIAVNLALCLENVELLDCDVEEPNAHIFLKPLVEETHPSFIPIPEIDDSKCSYCGVCREVCEYNALAVIKPKDKRKGSVLVFPNLCHGCGACSMLCPEKAITEVNRETGKIEKGKAGEISFIRGVLNVGETMAPPVIRQVKQRASTEKTIIIDAPPGTSCPVITAVRGTDYCILVTEPTPFGLNDLELAVEALKKLKIPFGVVINRCDIGDDETKQFCFSNNIEILMEIPFDREIAVLYSSGHNLIDNKKEYRAKFRSMFELIKRKVNRE